MKRKIADNISFFWKNLLESIKFVHKNMGVLLVYIVICSLFVNYVAFGLFRFAWGYALKSIPGNYLTDHNIIQLIKHPTAIIIGLLIAVCFCVICLWQNTGILMIIEYHRQGKPVKIVNIMWEALLQIRHSFHPKNWMIFIYLLVILPFTDPNMTMAVLSELVIPEFISDFILANKALFILQIFISLVLIYCYYRFVFVQYSFILERMSFKEAANKSRRIGFKTQFFVGLSQGILSVVAHFLYVLLPTLLFFIISRAGALLWGQNELSNAAATIVFHAFGVDLAKHMGTSFVKLLVFSYMIIIFHAVYNQKGESVDIQLPKGCEKHRGKIRAFRGWVIAAVFAVYALFTMMVAIFIISANNNPEVFAQLFGPTQIAAHKGYSSKAPENTMDAFEMAEQSKNVDYIELDVRSTKDGVPVVIHNESLHEATGKDISIYDVDYDELQNMSAPYSFKDKYPDARIPALETVLETYGKNTHFIIEIKDSPRAPKLTEQIVGLMEKYDIVESSVIHSGSYEAISKVKEINPNIKCGYIIAVSMGGFYDLENADFFSLEHDFATDRVVRNIHERGKDVYVWTVNDNRSMEEVRYSMIDVVITDYPDTCSDTINEDANLISRIFDEAIDQMGFDDIDNISDIMDDDGPSSFEVY